MFGSASKTNMPESSMAKIIKIKPDIKETTIPIMFFDTNKIILGERLKCYS